MKHTPKITVSGFACEGKTTIINIIRNALIEKGFNINVRDLDGTMYPIPVLHAELAESAVRQRIGSDSILIIEQQVSRCGFTKEIK